MVKIEKGIPAPKETRGRKAKYPWATLEIGESFLAPNGNVFNFRPMASRAGRDYGRRYKVQEVKGGVRVWRVA